MTSDQTNAKTAPAHDELTVEEKLAVVDKLEAGLEDGRRCRLR